MNGMVRQGLDGTVQRNAIREMRQEILATVRWAMQQVMEETREEWLSEAELCQQFQMFSHHWLKLNGQRLPRTKCVKSNRWAYPRNKIARLIREGKLPTLTKNWEDKPA